ncbi:MULTISPECIES: hypothetical protein [Methylosinus]|uniref:Uncharacterized protein n=1 Tax=Methylosinus trichosporium (strain ATCC 35070 / NCIMB 11131 / UNIQEM 75 / OB3b) TaxID=595536 RepID=A0A2D2CVU5_METT3|nr:MULTISPECIES: hypothetical protein [Methylosinus]ATQ66898.1 hypothetical protein CQW49_02540 [Methylosinus trichosporium OB3b]OBS54139.1 hypothetical protein A8B73_02600 [Methylosinus sp. 3S-1]
MDRLQNLLADQERDAAAIDRAVAAAQVRVQALDKDLRADVLRDREAELRLEALRGLTETRRAMLERAEAAQAQARRLTPEAERRAARFHNDDAVHASMSIATYARLERTSTPELMEHLADAIEDRNLALAEAVRLEFGRRNDAGPLREQFAGLFGRLRSPAAEEAKQAVSRIAGLSGLAAERLLTLERGRGDAAARLAAARMMAA